MTALLAYTIFGLVTGGAYAVVAGGLVLTYSTSKVFNVGHGAIGMVMAFLYWELAENRGLPQWLALLLVVGVCAPLFGLVVERFVMRRLAGAPVGITLVAGVGLLVGLIGVAQVVWPPQARPVRPFLDQLGVHVGQSFVSGHDLVTLACAVLVAGGLYVLLNRTRTGLAMRACVDAPELAALYGTRPARLSALSWAIGSALAALGGILLTPVVQLDYVTMTLLVITAYTAALVGRLRSLPWTFAGALGLGLVQSYAVAYLPSSPFWISFRAAIPALLLFVVLLAMPQSPLRIGGVRGSRGVAVPNALTTGVGAGLFAGVVVALALLVDSVVAGQLALALVFGIVLLSMVLLTGYGGVVSLGQFTFVGVGAVTVARLGSPSPVTLLIGAGVAAAVGAVIALTALRVSGLYLALATLGFAQLMDKLVLQSPIAFGVRGSLQVPKLVESASAQLLLAAAVFVLVGVGVLAVRRGRFGRRMIAVKDSSAACATLGLNVRWIRVWVFSLSAAIAGLAGGLFAQLRETVAASDFQLFNNLPLLLFAVIAGVTSVSGALLGGVLLMLLPVLQSGFPAFAGVAVVLLGVAAAGLAREPNGLVGWGFRAWSWRRA
ncbi:ABC transporter permease [Lentzea flaviverrucosa]|uniref:Branched-chain amino acid transport system permease protein n=1 Tax=Lentzea flaviverrucosa TaxID=200379 RepID=A0A1H9K385_9PSEU|nr:ABC transporter permease [Lentzea flaviverrucosa]RDI26720.1 branched-chain amino acid transport system permease protein [Lentzea flaviverrucosa]SEQ93285.1 branched-chain amino acid transport system permease protein [Lentzea flaviverrucosa]